MVIDASRPVFTDLMVQSTIRCTSSSPAAKLCGVNAPISMLAARSLKKLATPPLPALGPYQGALLLAASAAQSTSSLRRSRMLGPEGGDGGRVSDVLLNPAHQAVLDAEQGDLRVVE